jgi:hypothetical protein
MGEINININIFLELREKCIEVLEHIQSKADTLQKTYSCFQEVTDTYLNSNATGHGHSHGGGGHIHTRKNADYDKKWGDKTIKKSIERPKIGGGNREISKEDHIKRDFMSFINKLSDNNLKNVATYFENNFQIDFIDIYIKLLWEAILRSEEYQYLYIDCLNSIYNITLKTEKQQVFLSKINNLWQEYYNGTKWIPSDDIVNDEDYDDFCDFVKWKKTALTYIHGFSKFIIKEWLSVSVYSNILNELLNGINVYLEKTPEGCKITDALLDQMITLIQLIKLDYNESIYNFIQYLNVNSKQFKPSTRFKVYDIIESIQIHSYINV